MPLLVDLAHLYVFAPSGRRICPPPRTFPDSTDDRSAPGAGVTRVSGRFLAPKN